MKLFATFSIASVVFAYDAEGVVDDDTCIYGGEEVDCETKQPLVPILARGGKNRALSDGDRRYADLKAIHSKMWSKNGLKGSEKFDERQLWAYGCHCHLLGDRPLSEMGRGAPKDALDNKCKAYKDCQKCVRMKHGDTCIGEFVQYNWKYQSKQKDFVSQDVESSCGRELFECDVQFAKDSFNQLKVFDESYHFFYGNFDNRDPDNCVSTPSIPVEHQCCGGHNKPFHWIGMNKHQCCADGLSGRVVEADQEC